MFMSLSKQLIKEMEKLGLKIQSLKHKEGRIYEMLVQPELIEKETTWELEDKMRKKKKNYSELFNTNRDSEDGIL